MIKALMYHYVRHYDDNYPYFRFLELDNFRKQLDYLETEYGFVKRNEWNDFIKKKRITKLKGKIILTFDDALSCHFNYVFPELEKRGLWGIFYVPTSPYSTKKILDVHKIHLLCGAFEGIKIYEILQTLLDERMIPQKRLNEFRNNTYVKQENYKYIKEIKRILNYFVDYKYREGLIDNIFSALNFKYSWEEFYVSIDNLMAMQLSGNIIGSHGYNHLVMSQLSEKEQRKEKKNSLYFLERNGLNLDKTYCHPYGGFHTFNKETIKILAEEAIGYSFNVEPRDIFENDIINSPYYLPRYDCNQFKYGKAS